MPGVADAGADDGGEALDAEAPASVSVEAVVMKVWRLRQPYLLTDDATRATPLGSSRPRDYGGGQGELTYLSRLGDGFTVGFTRLDGATVLAWVALDGRPPVVLATLTDPNRMPPVTAPSPDGQAVAYYDDGRVWSVSLAGERSDLGAFGPGPADDLVWTADGAWVVATAEGVSVAFDGQRTRNLPAGGLMGAGTGARIYVRSEDDRALQVDLSTGAAPVTITPADQRVLTLIGATEEWVAFAFSNRAAGQFARRIGAVSPSPGPTSIRWLSAGDVDGRDGVVRGDQVFFVAGRRGGEWVAWRSSIDGASARAISAPRRATSTFSLLAIDDERLYGCDGRAAALAVPLDGEGASWTSLAPELDGQCRFRGVTETQVVMWASDREPTAWRVPKTGGAAEPIGDGFAAIFAEGVVTLEERVSSQLVRIGAAGRQELTEPVEGLLVDRGSNGALLARFSTGGELVARTGMPTSRWRVYDPAGVEAPRWVSPAELGGRDIAIDGQWLIVQQERQGSVPQGDVYTLSLDGLFDGVQRWPERRLVNVGSVSYDRFGQWIVGLTPGATQMAPLASGAMTTPFAGGRGLVPHPTRSAIFVVRANQIYEYDLAESTSRVHASIPSLSGQLTVSPDGEYLIAIEVSDSTAVPHPRAGWSVPVDGTSVEPRRFEGIPVPVNSLFDPGLAVPPTGDLIFTDGDEGLRLEPIDASDPGVLIVPRSPDEVWTLDPVYGPAGRWYAVGTASALITYSAGQLRTREVRAARFELEVAADDHVVLRTRSQTGESSLWAYRADADEPILQVSAPGHDLDGRGIFGGPTPVVAVPDGSGVIYTSDAEGDRSLYLSTFGEGVQALTAHDDAEEILIGFVP